MSVENIQEQIKVIQKRIDVWPAEDIKNSDERSKILTMTDDHFSSVETDLQKLLEQCKMLPSVDQISVTPHLKELKDFVQKKFLNAEKELTEVKGKMGQGRHHVKAIKAYTKS